MTRLLRTISTILLLLAAGYTCLAQDPTLPDIGIRPFGPYVHSDVYHVNLQNGNVYGQIPLVSIPQKGNLPPLEFFLKFNTSPYVQQESCDSVSGTCYWYYDLVQGYNLPRPGVQLSTSYSGGDITYQQQSIFEWEQCPYGAEFSCIFGYGNIPQWTVSDITGSTHPMLYDSAMHNRLYATDGSGYSVVFPTCFTPTNQLACAQAGLTDAATIYSPNGLSYHTASATKIVSDPLNNSVTRSGTYTAGIPVEYWITDSAGRVFPDVETALIDMGSPSGYSTDVSKCPDIGLANQAPVYSIQTNLPVSGGQLMPYLLCYTTVFIHTAFSSLSPMTGTSNLGPIEENNSAWPYYETINSISNGTGIPYDPPYGDIFLNTVDSFTAIQSVVLPNSQGTILSTNPYWGFVYDASTTTTDSSGRIFSTEAYGTVNKIIYPSGASSSFSFINTNVLPIDSHFFPAYRSLQQVDTNDGLGNLSHTTYTYGPVITDQVGVHLYRVGGPVWTDVTDAIGDVTRHTMSRMTSSTSQCLANTLLEETQVAYYRGAATGQPIKTIDTQYQVDNTQDISCAYVTWDFIAAVPSTVNTYVGNKLASTTSYQYSTLFSASAYECDLGGLHCWTIPPTGMSVPYGVPYQTTQYDGSGNLLFTRTTPPVYTSSSGSAYRTANMLNLPASTQITDGAGTQVALTTYGYDESPSPQGQYGNVTSIKRWLNTTGQNLTTSTVYNADGKPSLETDANLIKTSIPSYQCSAVYPQTVIKPYQSSTTAAETTTYSYDCNTGSLLGMTDPNGIQTQYVYTDSQGNADPLGRIRQIKRALGTPSESHSTIDYPSMTQANVAQDQTTVTDGHIQSTTIYDGFGRVIQQKNPDGNYVCTTYNSVGQVATVSSPVSSCPASSGNLITYYYDPLGRKVKETEQDGNTRWWCYDGVADVNYPQPNCSAMASTNVAGASWIDSTDEAGIHHQQISDSLGELVAAIEPSPQTGALALETDYSYDALGNLLSVNQLGVPGETARVRSFTYDSLSRLLTSTNSETGTICYGTWSGGHCVNGYDPDGNLLAKTDARGVTTNYSYDSLNRLRAKSYSYPANAAAGALLSCYAYDTATNGIGRLGVEWTTSGSCSTTAGYETMRRFLAYDPMGRLWNEQQCVLGHCTSGPTPPQTCLASGNNTPPYYQTFCYDLMGNLSWSANGVTNVPSISSIGFTPLYDGAGRLSTLASSWNDALHPSPLFTVDPTSGYTPAGALQTFSLGNHITVNKTYDNRLRTAGETAIQQ